MASVTFDYARMQEAASGGFMNALAGAAYLVRSGVPFRTAHERSARPCSCASRRAASWSTCRRKNSRAAASRLTPAFYHALQLQQVLAIHDVPGGTAPSQVRAALKQVKETLLMFAGAAHVCA